MSAWAGFWIGGGLALGLTVLGECLQEGMARLARGLERAARKDPVDGKS